MARKAQRCFNQAYEEVQEYDSLKEVVQMNPIVSIAHQVRKVRINHLQKKLMKEKDLKNKERIRNKIIALDKADRSYWIRKRK